jgi:mannose-6-phosphate isomerase-like protein (cupin superfamily)
MPIHKTQTVGGNKLSLLKSEESLRSRQYHGLLVRVVYERDFLEIVRTEMEPGSALDNGEFGSFPVVHVVVEGSPVFEAPAQSNVLVPGDTVAVGEGEQYRFYNPTSSRSTILSVLVKVSEQQQIVGGGVRSASG